MRIPTRERSVGLRFNVTPLIDVVFLLIIFFLAASHFVRSDHAEEVELAKATQEELEDRKALPLVITIRRDQALVVRGEVVSQVDINQMIDSGRFQRGERFAVHVRADKTVPYRLIEPILMACARNQVAFKFAVILEPG